MDLDGAKTWRRIFKTCKQFMHHVQNSVFEGELTKGELMQLRTNLKVHIRSDLDSFIVYQVSSEKQLTRNFWGLQEDKTDTFL